MGSVRILYVLTSLGIGGAEKQVIDLAERMKARGHMVAFLVLKHSAEEWPVTHPVLRLNLRKTPRSLWRGLQFAKRFLALSRPDVLHSHTFPANLFARMLRAILPASEALPRLVNTIHNVYEGGWHRMLLYRLTDRWADRMTAVSEAAAERFTQARAVPAAKMTVLTNGVDTDLFAPDRARRRRARAQMLVSDGISGEFVWLAVGRLVAAKDYPNLLRAFDKLRLVEPEARLWIAGEGDPVQLQLDAAGTQDALQVQWLGLRRDVVDLLDAADGFVLSSAWEGMPLALAEAMAMEKTVVATDVGGVRELVGDAGYIVPARDSEALSDAMLQAMSMPRDRRRFMGAAARSRVRQYHSMQAKADEWERLYAQVMSETRR